MTASGLAGLLASAPGCARAAAEPRGAEAYARACLACHQADGAGVPGVAPPLAGRAGRLVRTEAGRRYVVAAVLFGLVGAVPPEGQPFAGPMPPASFLKDDEVAALLQYVVTSWGNDKDLPEAFPAIAPPEVARLRSQDLPPAKVAAERPR